MAGLSVERYFGQLEAQLEREDVRKAIRDLRKANPVFARYPTVEDLVYLGRPGVRDYEDKDSILATLLSELKRKMTLFPLLNKMFWWSLLRLFYNKRRTVPDEDDLFVRIQTEFFHVAASYPLDRRPRKIDVNLLLDTKKKISQWQRDEASFRDLHEEWVEKHEIRIGRRKEWISSYEDHLSLADLQVSGIFPEELETCLLDLLYRKVINDRQYDLLLETEVYKRMTQKVWAETRGVAYATARSWHYRAVTAIQKYVQARRQQEEAE